LARNSSAVKLFLDAFIDERTWSLLVGSPEFPQNTVFYENTFRLSDSNATTRTAIGLHSMSQWLATGIELLSKNKKIAMSFSKKKKMYGWIKDKVMPLQQKMAFSYIMYSSDKTYLIIPDSAALSQEEQEYAKLLENAKIPELFGDTFQVGGHGNNNHN
jgi:hypothetical protein